MYPQVCENALYSMVRAVVRCTWAVLEKDMKWGNDDYTAQTPPVTSCTTYLQSRKSVKI